MGVYGLAARKNDAGAVTVGPATAPVLLSRSQLFPSAAPLRHCAYGRCFFCNASE